MFQLSLPPPSISPPLLSQGLFRKVLRSEIDTRSLVRMSSEKLASEELAQWRVQTMKRDLEKIKEREEEVGAMGGTIRKMTYKGEVEIEHTEEHLEVSVCMCVCW